MNNEDRIVEYVCGHGHVFSTFYSKYGAWCPYCKHQHTMTLWQPISPRDVSKEWPQHKQEEKEFFPDGTRNPHYQNQKMEKTPFFDYSKCYKGNKDGPDAEI